MMSVEQNVALEPWETPDVVELVNPGLVSKWHLWELSAETLAKQCDRFRAEVFEKAGRDDPAEAY